MRRLSEPGRDPVAVARGIGRDLPRHARAAAGARRPGPDDRAGARTPHGSRHGNHAARRGRRVPERPDRPRRRSTAPARPPDEGPAAHPRGERRYSLAELITASVSPVATAEPTAIGSSATTPALCAVILFSIFIASLNVTTAA